MSETKPLTQVWRERGGVPLDEVGREQGYCAAMHDCATQLEFLVATNLAEQGVSIEDHDIAERILKYMMESSIATVIAQVRKAERRRIRELLCGNK